MERFKLLPIHIYYNSHHTTIVNTNMLIKSHVSHPFRSMIILPKNDRFGE